MEWMTLSGGIPCLSLIALGTAYQGSYYISKDCLLHLEEIEGKLADEDPITRPLRRSLGFMDILNNDLIPILVDSKNQPGVFRATVKLLVGLTVPVECLVSVDASSQSPTSQHIAHELTQLLYDAKEAFLDPRATRAILEDLHRLIEKDRLSTEESEAVNQSLLLIRNILHAPERPPTSPLSEPDDCVFGPFGGDQEKSCPTGGSQTPYLGPNTHSHGYTSDCSQQNRLLWNLFAQGLDRLLINMLACSQKDEWVVTIVQLIALFYKDQHAENLQKLLGSWLNSATSDSSEDDDESNTSPPIGPCNSPQVLTSSSDPTSDSSDSVQKNGCDPSEGNCEPVEGEKVVEEAPNNKSGRNKNLVRKTSDSASTSSHSTSMCSTSETSRKSSSTSSGFHSENSSGHNHQGGSKESEGLQHRRDSMKRRCHSGSRNITESGNAIKEESPDSCTDPVIKRSLKGKSIKSSNPPEKEQRRKKLNKRSKVLGRIKTKAIVQYSPSEDDIAQLLKEFTVDFLLNGYNTLVGELHKQLLRQDSLPLDKSHFLWLITYFLRFASQLELDIDHLKDIFNIELLSYLTWESVRETEEFEMSSLQPGADLKPSLRRLHLGVTAIREYLQALETYSRIVAGQSGALEKVGHIRGCLPAMKDLRQLFILQLRHYNPVIQSRRYLRDVLTANHVLLLTLERSVQQNSSYGTCFDLRDHLNQFCSRNVLDRYGMALDDFRTNGPFVNDCILTVLHHIGADLGRPDLLCEPVILRPFSKIWEEEFNMCDDWDDLIEYVVQKFLRNFQTGGAFSEPGTPASHPDSNPRSMASVDEAEEAAVGEGSGDHSASSDSATIPEIEVLRGRLRDSGFQKQLDWIQTCLLTVCSARLGSYTGEEFRNPIACLSIQMKVPCPMVPWTELEAAALRSELFLFLLHRMGLLPASPNAGLYPRIPREWSADALYSAALFFGPVVQQQVDFDLNRVHQIQLPVQDPSENLPMDGCLPLHPWLIQPYLGPGPSNSFTAMPTNWTYWVEQSGSLYRSAEITSQHGHNSVSLSLSNHSHRPLDSISTTSSLEVHKTDSSDDDEMDDGGAGGINSLVHIPGSTQATIHDPSSSSSSCFSASMPDDNEEEEEEETTRRPTSPCCPEMSTDSEEPFEMATLLEEIVHPLLSP